MRSITDVVARQMCTGCGVCAYLRPHEVRMVDDLDLGRRPVDARGAASDPDDIALAACPGTGLDHDAAGFPENLLTELLPAWGPVIEVLEGYAGDPDLRHAASSGGAASALALYGIERAGLHGVLHAAPRADVPWLNHTVLSRTRDELLAATGSRYAPASPCDGLGCVEEAPAPCVFLGKPCDVAATAAARRLRPELDARLGLTVAMFCAGTPSSRGTLEMLRQMGISDPASVVSVRYRGLGWPGLARVRTRAGSGAETEHTLSYGDSWQLLQRHRQWRCYVCADHTGEFADVSVGDPWHRATSEDEPGRSLILARTERGQRFVRAAMEAGYLVAEPTRATALAESQPELLRVRGAIWGRIQTCRLFGAAAPRYRGLPTFPFWRRLPWRERAQSVYGTARRIFSRGLRRRVVVRPVRRPRSIGGSRVLPS